MPVQKKLFKLKCFYQHYKLERFGEMRKHSGICFLFMIVKRRKFSGKVYTGNCIQRYQTQSKKSKFPVAPLKQSDRVKSETCRYKSKFHHQHKPASYAVDILGYHSKQIPVIHLLNFLILRRAYFHSDFYL